MKNIFKRFITCFISALLIAATAFAGGCTDVEGNGGGGGNSHTDPTKSGYTITILYPDDTLVLPSHSPNNRKPVSIQFYDLEGNDIAAAYSIVSETGTTVINYRQSGVFLIEINNCPTGYSYVNKVYTEEGRGDYTIKLTATSLDYTINVKLPDGSPVSNVGIKVKQNGVEIASAVTDTDGKAIVSDIFAGIYDLEFENLPDGYSYLPTQLSASSTTLNVELIKLTELKLDENSKMTDAQLDEWDALANYYDTDDDSPSIIRFNKSADCYDFTTDVIPEGKKLYYYFTADKDGTYNFISEGKYYLVQFYGNSLDEVVHSTLSDHFSTNTCEMVPLELKAGEIYYFAYSIPAHAPDASLDDPDEHELSGVRHFMIAKPVPGVKTHEVIAPNHTSPELRYDVSFDTDTAVLALETATSATPERPADTDGGIYEIRSNTDLYNVKIGYYGYFTGTSKNPDAWGEVVSGATNNFVYTLEVPPSYAGNTYYFKIVIESKIGGGEIEYPVEVPITITRKGNAEDNVSPVEYKHATATDKYPEQTGKTFHFLIDESTPITDFAVKEQGGVWYVTVGDVDYELVVAIKKTLPGLSYSYTTVEYMGEGNITPSEDNTGEVDDVPSDTRQNNNLSLYEDSSRGESKTNPRLNYTPFIDEYAAICNSDGVYGLNNELKVFLEKYYEQHWNDFNYYLAFGEKDRCSWLLSCGYYA